MIPDNIERWLAAEDREACVKTIIAYATDTQIIDEPDERYPTTVAEFVACRHLLQELPELQSCLPRVAHSSPAWGELVSFWDDLCLVHECESPDWREEDIPTPQTEEMLHNIIKRHEPQTTQEDTV